MTNQPGSKTINSEDARLNEENARLKEEIAALEKQLALTTDELTMARKQVVELSAFLAPAAELEEEKPTLEQKVDVFMPMLQSVDAKLKTVDPRWTEEYVLIEDAVEISGLHDKHIRRLKAEGKIEGKIEAGRLWIKSASLMKWKMT